MPRPRRYIPIGTKFGNWTVEEETTPNDRGARVMVCRCQCGILKKIKLDRLCEGSSKSCGCTKGEAISAAVRTHGESNNKSSEYRVWDGIIQRCENPNHTEYRHYGGRGITICKRWRDSYENFLSDIGRRPSLKHSIDRIDNNGHYEPDNCFWATKSQQRRNTRFNVWVEYNGSRRLLVDVCEELGINYYTAWDRVTRRSEAKNPRVIVPFKLCN